MELGLLHGANGSNQAHFIIFARELRFMIRSSIIFSLFLTVLLTGGECKTQVSAPTEVTSPKLPLHAPEAAFITPQDFDSNAGNGGDDSAAINAAIKVAALGTNNSSGLVYFPFPPSGSYNICAAHITRPSGAPNSVTLLGSASGGKATIRIMPNCKAPPNELIFDPSSNYPPIGTKSAARMRLENLRLDGYCLAKHILTIGYDPGFSSTNVVYRNAATKGSNIYIQQGYQYQFDGSNLAENVNDSDHVCYKATHDLPAYNVETAGTDSNFEIIGVGAQIANFFQRSGGNNHFNASHGWGYATKNHDGQVDSRPMYNYLLRGNAILTSAVGDQPKISAIRMQVVPKQNQVDSVEIVSPGYSGTPGIVTLTGTTGSGKMFQAIGYVDSSGSLSGALTVSIVGNYLDLPQDLQKEPVNSTGGLKGVVVSMTMGSTWPDVTGATVTNFTLNGPVENTVSGVSIGADIIRPIIATSNFNALSNPNACVVGDGGDIPFGANIALNVGCPTTSSFVIRGPHHGEDQTLNLVSSEKTSYVSAASKSGAPNDSSSLTLSANGPQGVILQQLDGKIRNTLTTGRDTFSVPIQTPGHKVNELAICDKNGEGLHDHVSDASVPVKFMENVVGGGTQVVPVFCNGNNWVVQ